MSVPEERLELLKAEHRRLEQYLRALSPEVWELPSVCDRWTVADVIAHLTDFHRTYAIWITDSLQANRIDSERLPRRSNQRVDAAAPVDRVIALRKALGGQLLSEFVNANRSIWRAFDQVGPNDWDRLCYRASGAEPIRHVLDAFIVDVGVHRWDVTFPFDSNAQLTPDCLAVMAERYPHRPRWWDIALPERHPALPARFRFAICGVSVPGTDVVVVSQDEKYMEAAADVPAHVTFTCDAQTFVLLAYGRLNPEMAFSQGQLTYNGHDEWVEIFMRAYTGG